jgi:hypothetical protein
MKFEETKNLLSPLEEAVIYDEVTEIEEALQLSLLNDDTILQIYKEIIYNYKLQTEYFIGMNKKWIETLHNLKNMPSPIDYTIKIDKRDYDESLPILISKTLINKLNQLLAEYTNEIRYNYSMGASGSIRLKDNSLNFNITNIALAVKAATISPAIINNIYDRDQLLGQLKNKSNSTFTTYRCNLLIIKLISVIVHELTHYYQNNKIARNIQKDRPNPIINKQKYAASKDIKDVIDKYEYYNNPYEMMSFAHNIISELKMKGHTKQEVLDYIQNTKNENDDINDNQLNYYKSINIDFTNYKKFMTYLYNYVERYYA